MARIANINVPEGKKVFIGLTYICGIGLTTALSICKEANISLSKKIKELSSDELMVIRSIIQKNYIVEGDLKAQVNENIKRKKDIKSYQGLRHMRKLPVNGQNTHSNARTRKGRKSLPVAGKKKATKK